jgi:hypothetical protein
VDLGTRKNLHNGAKVGKRFGDSKKYSYFCTKITYSTYGHYKNQGQKLPYLHS